MLLEKCAEILRCQIPRQRVNQDCPEGALPGGRMACRELMLENIDGSGFTDIEAAPLAVVKMSARSEKFLLCDNDILMVFAGVRDSLGIVGLVPKAWPVFVGRPAIPGYSLYVIRANTGPIDPVWLFYFLRQSRARILDMQTKVNRIGLRELARLDVPIPVGADVDAVKILHEKRLTEWKAILEGRKKMLTLERKINTLLSLNNNHNIPVELLP